MATIYNSQLDAFTLYHQTNEARSRPESFFSPKGTALPALGHAIAGSTGAAVSNICTYPLELIITRLQIQRQLRKDQSQPSNAEYKGLRDAAARIYRDEGGFAAFYTGLLQDTGKTIADSFLFFLVYNFLRHRRLAARGKSTAAILPAVEELAVGFIAGSLTKLLTTPLANVVTRKQASAMTNAQSSSPDSAFKTPSTTQIAQDILSQKGVLGFWSGYSASLVLTLNPSLTFFLFETFKRLLPRSRRSNPPAAATFLIAAFSKACASSVTYPFSLAKTRAQAGGKKKDENENERTEKNIKEASDGVLPGGEKQRAAARATIFGTVLEIARTEGLQGLYEGLPLEIAKGFFSHGITMIVKQAIHRMIVQLYYVLSILLSKYPRRSTPEKLAQMAKEQSFEYYDLAKARVSERVTLAKQQMQEAHRGASALVDGLSDGVKDLYNNAHETADFVADYVEDEAEEWRDLYGTGLAKWFDEK